MELLISQTDRLIIRNWTEDDINPYAKIIGDPEVMKYIGSGEARPFSEAVKAIEKYSGQIEQQGWARFALELKETKELIGFCGFDHYNGELDFGWRLSRQHWGKGLATEAAKEVFRLGVELFHFPRIVCISYRENTASINVIRKLEMPFEKDITLNGRSVLQFAYEKAD
ncbi:MAG: GNAT family N-acetyltransferase [Fluviicola sp.]